MERAVDFLAEPLALCIFNMFDNSVCSEFVLKEIFSLALGLWHAFGKDYLLPLFVLSNNALDKLGVLRVVRGQSKANDFFHAALQAI